MKLRQIFIFILVVAGLSIFAQTKSEKQISYITKTNIFYYDEETKPDAYQKNDADWICIIRRTKKTF